MRQIIVLCLLMSFSTFAQESVNPIGSTLLDGKVFDVYQTEQGTVYKPRTEKTKDPEEAARFENLLNRQKMFEIGALMGGAEAAGGEVPGGYGVFFNSRIPHKAFRRVNIGGEIRDLGHNAGWENPIPSGKTWKALAEYDFILIPQEWGAMSFSAGYAFGRYNMELASNTSQTGYEVVDQSNQHFLSVRYKWIMEQNFANQRNEDGSVSHSFVVAYKVSKQKSQEWFVGYAIGFGKKASPKVEKTK